MAINVQDIQNFLGASDETGERSNFRSDSGYVGRCWIDGALVIYDPQDCPRWLADALGQQDEDGNTGAERVGGLWERAIG